MIVVERATRSVVRTKAVGEPGPAAGRVVADADGPAPAALTAWTESVYVSPGRRPLNVWLRAVPARTVDQGPLPPTSTPFRLTR